MFANLKSSRSFCDDDDSCVEFVVATKLSSDTTEASQATTLIFLASSVKVKYS